MPLDDASAPPPPPINLDEMGLESPPIEIATESPTEVPTQIPTEVPTRVATALPTQLATATPLPSDTDTPFPTPHPSITASHTPQPLNRPSPPPPVLQFDDTTPLVMPSEALPSGDEGIPAAALPPPEELVPGQGLDASQIGAYNVAPPSWMFTPEPTHQSQPESSEAYSRLADDQPRLKLKGKKDKFGDRLDAELKKLPKAEREKYFGVAMLVAHARELEDQGRLYEAWRAYRDALAKNPGHKLALKGARGFYVRRFFGHARELAKSKRYFEAANLYGDVINADPGHSGAWYGLGVIFYKYEKKAEALRCFDQVVKLRPDLKDFLLWVENYRL